MMEKIENTEGIERRGNVLAAMAKLKQVYNHPAQLLPNPPGHLRVLPLRRPSQRYRAEAHSSSRGAG